MFLALPFVPILPLVCCNAGSWCQNGLCRNLYGPACNFVLLFLTPLFADIPQCALAAIVISAVIGLADYDEAIFFWRVDKKEFLLWLAASFFTLFLGIEVGVLIGVFLSLVVVFYESANPYMDSTVLTETKRDELYDSLLADSLMGWAVDVIDPKDLSAKMLRREKISLNNISFETAMSLIRNTLNLGDLLSEIKSMYNACFSNLEMDMYCKMTNMHSFSLQAAYVFINFASFRSAYGSSMEPLKQPTIRVVAIIAEGVPEADAKRVIPYARANNKVVNGPATVGGIQSGAFNFGGHDK
ncbi:hypothetical protein M758_UG063900 [Ceratodon purpureus]|nr:hypothetical protein M758_UG063900 [Ceratodon purpureus]